MRFQHLPVGSPWIPIFLTFLSVAVWTEMDLFVPSLPDMMRYFGTTETVIQWSLSFNFLGFFIASLFCGPLSDALGRRKVMLLGTVLFLIGSFFSVLSTHIEVFLLGRLIQGIGVSAPAVMTMAIMADMYEGTRFIRWTSALNAVITVTMAVAPIVGVYLNIHWGWRSNFFVIAVLALLGFILILRFVPETLPVQYRKQFEIKQLIDNYRTLLMSRQFMLPMLGLCALVTPYFVFVGIISLLYINELKIPMEAYGYYQGSVVGTFSVLSLIVSIFGAQIDLNRFMKLSFWIVISSAFVLCLHGLFLVDSALELTFLMALMAAGMVVPCTVLYMQAIQVYKDLQGSAGALFQSIRMLMLSMGTAVAGFFYNGSYMPIGLITGFYAALGVVFVFPLLKVKVSCTGNTPAL